MINKIFANFGIDNVFAAKQYFPKAKLSTTGSSYPSTIEENKVKIEFL